MEASKKPQTIMKLPKIKNTDLVDFKTGFGNFIRANPDLKMSMLKHVKAVKIQAQKAISGVATQSAWNEVLKKF